LFNPIEGFWTDKTRTLWCMNMMEMCFPKRIDFGRNKKLDLAVRSDYRRFGGERRRKQFRMEVRGDTLERNLSE